MIRPQGRTSPPSDRDATGRVINAHLADARAAYLRLAAKQARRAERAQHDTSGELLLVLAERYVESLEASRSR
ncbi:MAG: hypothetical protein U1E52_01310 [Geminicoccaceae bacterium]